MSFGENQAQLYRQLERAQISTFLLDELQAYEDAIADGATSIRHEVAIHVLRQVLEAVRTGKYADSSRRWVTMQPDALVEPAATVVEAEDKVDFWRS